jgi:hypothetical protein
MLTTVKNRELNYGDSVRVYWNFHKKLFSIQKKINGRWLVVSHSNKFMLVDVVFKVNEKARQKVIKNKVKNVHAFVYGKLSRSGMGISGDSNNKLPCVVKYNPYKLDCFYSDNLTVHTYKVKEAMCVKFTDRLVTAAYTSGEKIN